MDCDYTQEDFTDRGLNDMGWEQKGDEEPIKLFTEQSFEEVDENDD